MGCAGSSDSKPSRWSCKDYLCPDEVEPMEMPRNPAGIRSYGSSSIMSNTRSPSFTLAARETSTSASFSMPMNPQQSPTQVGGVPQNPNQFSGPSRPNFLLGLGSPPRSYPANYLQIQQQDPPHSVDCQRRRVMLHNRQMRMLSHHQPIVLLPHLHLHSLPPTHLHMNQRNPGCSNQNPSNPVAHHNPWRRSSLYYGQGYIVAHHNHHHHVNFQ